jgi:lactoylglutathione lyase
MALRGWCILLMGLVSGCSSAEDTSPTELGPSQQASPQATAGAPSPTVATPMSPMAPLLPALPQMPMAMPPVPMATPPAPMPGPDGAALPPAPTPTPAAPEPPREPLPAPRIAFASFAVSDIEKSLAFYVGQIGMDELGRRDLTSGTTEVAVGFADDPAAAGLLLLSTPDQGAIQHGTAYSRFGLTVEDATGLVTTLRSAGVTIMTQPMRTASLGLTYAMIRDPDGYLIELIENDMPVLPDLPRIGFVSFNIADETKTMDFYVGLLGMRRNGMYAIGNGTTEIFVGFPDATGAATLVLLADPNRNRDLMHDDAFNRFGMRVTDLGDVLTRAGAGGFTIAEPQSRDEARRLQHATIEDPDGFMLELQQYD